MKTDTLEKIRNILEHLFVLFISILIMLTAFGSLPVHAEESNEYIYTLSFAEDNSGSWPSRFEYVCEYHSSVEIALIKTDFTRSFVSGYSGKNVVKYGYFPIYLTDDKSDTSGSKKIYYGGSLSRFDGNKLYDTEEYKYFDANAYGTFYSVYYSNFSESFCTTYYNDGELETNMKIFNSVASARLYAETGDTSGIINGGSIDNPDFEDSAFAFTGFTANNKMTATWTGTTERSYLKDQEVEEYVRVNYYFADKEAQDTIKQADAYPDEFATADKTLTIDVSGLKPDDENWFLRYIRITPCYRQAGLGAWGDFYHGEPSYVYFNQDGSIDRIDAPFIKGELSSDMERPVIVLHEAANGNPTESDYSYFEFNNAQSDYFFEMKGRWYTTNDFDLYRDKLVWKYKYSTLLKNNLSTWVSVSDNRSSVGRFQFDVLGKSSWDNLLSSYPVDDRNYIGGSYDLFNKITGYSDALETLKMLLKQPYSLFNGYEVYVRYFRFDENGGIQYSKWTHFYNNLADSEGSSGSRLDDLDNMYSENQSDKGLTDDELSDLEDGGNSRNDLDAVPKNNYDYSSLENATMNFFDLLTNFGTMLGQFPSMVAAVFSFLPSWLIGLIAVAIGAVIFCRFIGR